MIIIPGSWKSIEEVEENVTLDDVITLLSKYRELRHHDREFEASLHGKELEGGSGGSGEDPFQKAVKNAEARLTELSQEAKEEGGAGDSNDDALRSMGISVTKA